MEWITAWLDGIPDTLLRACVLAGLIVGFAALVMGVYQMYMSRSRCKELKITQDRIVDYLHREFDKRIEADTKFDAPEMTASGSFRRKKKHNFLFTLLRTARVIMRFPPNKG